MAGLRRTLTILALGSAIFSRSAAAQHGSSVSLTHTVTVTVPPRVKVQLAPVAPATRSTSRAASGQTADGLALSVNATQSWTLSIGSIAGGSQHQWSFDRDSGFAAVTSRHATIASGVLSSTPTTATVFFRTSAVSGSVQPETDSTGSDAVLLTVVAP
jgi:hypothetical protein